MDEMDKEITIGDLYSDEDLYLDEEISLVESRLIPLDDVKDSVIKNCNYEDLVKLREELELLLFLLDLKRFCDFVKVNKELVKDLNQYKKKIQKVHKKVVRLIKKKKKKLPPVVRTLIDEFGGNLES